MTSVYLIGSLRNPAIPELGNVLRAQGFEAFEDWFSAGFEADDQWQKYEKLRGRSYKEALQGFAAKHVFAFDKFHLDRCDAAVLVMPAGRSGHMELGYFAGTGKPGYVLFDKEPERYDVMYQFAKDVFFDKDSLILALKKL
jgi:nucleoside 2-deoxyribosyltransferase